MILYKRYFNTYQPILIINVWLDNNGMVEVIRMGTITKEVVVKGTSKKITLKDVLHLPKIKKNLLLMNKLVTDECKV